MPLRQAATDDSTLNMTPMIDIVFQLILFFLFSLKFKSLDHRHEAMVPTDRGLEPVLVFPPPFPAIKVAVTRTGGSDAPRTRLELAGRSWELPTATWTGRPTDDERIADARERVKQSLRESIARLHDDPELKGQIRVPTTSGGSVPHGDVVLVLDAFVEAGVANVAFDGGAFPGRRR